MPISQSRLIDLVTIYGLQIDRIITLRNQTRALQNSAARAYSTQNLDELWTMFQLLVNEVNHVTEVRMEEYQVYADEKTWFERNRDLNNRNREFMARARARKSKPERATEEQVFNNFMKDINKDDSAEDKQAKELFDKIEGAWRPPMPPITIDGLVWLTQGKISEGRILQRLIPRLISQQLILQPNPEKLEYVINYEPSTEPPNEQDSESGVKIPSRFGVSDSANDQ